MTIMTIPKVLDGLSLKSKILTALYFFSSRNVKDDLDLLWKEIKERSFR